MTLRLLALASLVLLAVGCAGEAAPSADSGMFVDVKIPESIEPLERGAKYEEPLEDALEAGGLGEVTGGGSQLGPPKADGTSDILSVDLDVELTKGPEGLALLRRKLKALNAQKGTTLIYDLDGKHTEEKIW
jgi:hypothetical protein